MEAKASVQDTAITQLGGLIRPYIPPTQAEQGPSQMQPSPIQYQAEEPLRKRKDMVIASSQDSSPSTKRRSTGYQPRTLSQPISASQSATTSPYVGSSGQCSVGPTPITSPAMLGSSFGQTDTISQQPDVRLPSFATSFGRVGLGSPDMTCGKGNRAFQILPASHFQPNTVYGQAEMRPPAGEGFGNPGTSHGSTDIGYGQPSQGATQQNMGYGYRSHDFQASRPPPRQLQQRQIQRAQQAHQTDGLISTEGSTRGNPARAGATSVVNMTDMGRGGSS